MTDETMVLRSSVVVSGFVVTGPSQGGWCIRQSADDPPPGSRATIQTVRRLRWDGADQCPGPRSWHVCGARTGHICCGGTDTTLITALQRTRSAMTIAAVGSATGSGRRLGDVDGDLPGRGIQIVNLRMRAVRWRSPWCDSDSCRRADAVRFDIACCCGQRRVRRPMFARPRSCLTFDRLGGCGVIWRVT
jgi:hypothetical protein